MPAEDDGEIDQTYFWTGRDCPEVDCDGELQQQDWANVMCLSCERVWSHSRDADTHKLQTQTFDTVAEEPIRATDGGADQSADEVEQSVSEGVREDLERQEPSEAEKQPLRQQHDGHLVRDTTSKLAVDSPEVGEGMEVKAKAEIPDTYCFTCEEWVGLSGVNLRGTPRSRTEAYYLGGTPVDVLHAQNGTAKTLNELADRLTERVKTVENRDDAYQFISAELEKLQRGESGAE